MNRIIKISTQTSIEEIIQVFKKRDFLRVPVVDPKRHNYILGIFHCKEVLRLKAKMVDGKGDIDWKDHIVQPLKVNYRINLEQLFNRFRRNRNHFALIFDDQQKCIGVITLDDILRHLFGSTATIGD